MDVHAGKQCRLLLQLLLLHAFLLFSATSAIAAMDNSTDLSSLLAFKASTTSDHAAANWTTDASFCTWVGVGCSRRRPRVVSLNLSSFSLQGTLSPHLSNLSFLSSLDLSNNSLSGTIPDALARLPRLATLLLGHNLLSGPIPRSLFNMSSLVFIDLSHNNLSSSLPTPAMLPRIETISVTDNLLTGQIPSNLVRCSTLQLIDLARNKLTGSVPSSFGNLSELVVLSLGQNQFSGAIPASIGNLTELQNLFLGYNGLEGEIPKELGNLVNLQYLNLHGNGIAGSMPISLWNASKMIHLSVSANNLTGPVPATLGKSMPFLQILCMAQNALSGGLDFITSLTNCKDLITIEVGVNQFEGVLSEVYVGNLSMNLQYFYLDHNNIKGRIPAGLGNLSSLILLALSNNELTGTIPKTLWRLKKLQMMYLGFNRLTGSIPSDIGSMTNLATISFPENEFSGQIPDSVGNIIMLQNLDLSVNKFSSSIPLSLCSLTGLITLDLHQNRFEGFLPPQMANLKSIDAIYLSSNRLSGNISSALGELRSITYLDLSNNSFNGQIPQQLGRLFNVKYLNLSHNFLSGAIPKSFLNLSYITKLDLSFNMLDGEIPEGKVFSNVSITSLVGNRALCGAPQFQFPPCPAIVTTNSNVKLRLLKYVLPYVASVLVFLACFSFFIKKIMRKKAKASSKEESLCLNYHRWIPYIELAHATDNFSEANLLGRGSFGKVYKGSLYDGLVVAVKVLNLEVEGALRSFDAECLTLGQVRHRNLVKIISTCSNLEFKALVLEFMPNQSLDNWLYSDKQCLNLLQRLNIMLDVSLGLDYLHHQHPHVIVHCDLKPSNILLDENMIAHISDFGIAKLMLNDNKSIVSTNNIGTIGYMAPEYGSTGGITIRGDVYSFGILLLELVTGKKPVDTMFNGELNLRQWVCNAYPTAMMEIVDNNILRTEFTNLQQHSDRMNILHRCLSSIIEVGLQCSKDLPNERLLMRDVVPRLQLIKNGVLVN